MDIKGNFFFLDQKLLDAVSALRERLEPVCSTDRESDLELAFFVVGWSFNGEQALAAIGKGRALRASSAILATARARVRSGEFKSSTDLPHYSAVSRYWRHDIIGDNKILTLDQCPVAICRIGDADLWALQENVSVEHFREYMVYAFEHRLYMLERLASTTHHDRRQLPRFVDIHCLNCPRGWFATFSPRSVGYFKWWLSELAICYPEQCSHVILLNTPYLFHTGWYYVKSWLPARTIDKIDILDADMSTWQSALERCLSRDQVSKLGQIINDLPTPNSTNHGPLSTARPPEYPHNIKT